MPLKAVVDTLDDLNEDQRPFYLEDDGKFYLDLDPETLKQHHVNRPLMVALDRLKAENAEGKSKLTDALAKLEAKPDPSKADEAEMARIREQLERERDEAIANAKGLEKQVYGLTVESQLDALLRDNGVSQPPFLRAAKREIQEFVKVVGGKPVAQTDAGDFSLADFVKHYLANAGAAFVSPPSGGGATGGKKTIAADKKPEELSVQERRELLQSNSEEFYRIFPQARIR
jgi:hypothetical protein